MKTAKRKSVKKAKPVPDDEPKIQIEEEPIPEPEPDWKESSTRDNTKNKFCKPCLKRNSCVISSIAMVMTCDRLEVKKKRTKG